MTTQRQPHRDQKRNRMSREHQLTHQYTCRKPRAPSHCRTGSVVDVTATSFPVTNECSRLCPPQTGFTLTSTISASFRVCAWFVINLLLPLERNEAFPSCLPASSRTCQVSLFPLHAITDKGWHSTTGSRVHLVLTLLDVLVHGHVLSRHTQRVYHTAGREGERRAVR